jgi:hypothetical protein
VRPESEMDPQKGSTMEGNEETYNKMKKAVVDGQNFGPHTLLFTISLFLDQSILSRLSRSANKCSIASIEKNIL